MTPKYTYIPSIDFINNLTFDYVETYSFQRGQDKTIVSTLNICLSCNYMETKMFDHIDGDFETYYLLKRFFIDIGHEVEKPDYFILDDINKMKSKYNIKPT